MTVETVNVRETARFQTHEPRSRFSLVLRETFRINEIVAVTPSANVHEVAQFNDAAYPSSYSLLRDTAEFNDAAYPNLRIFGFAHDVFRIDDRLSSWRRILQTSRETAIIHGRAVAPPSALLHEVFKAFGRPSAGSTTGVSLHETARFKDAAFPANSARLHEIFNTKDSIVSHTRAIRVVHEVATLNDAVFPTFVTRSALHEIFHVNDRISTKSTTNGRLHEVFYVTDRAVPPANGRAYTCSILSWGMSTYENYPFLTKAGNYAAGANLWRLDAVTDYNTPIDAWIVTGMLDMGASRGKRPSAIYAAGSSLEPLTVVVTGDVYGARAEFSYTLDLRDQTNYRNNRAILGKGFRSRYLQFKLHAGKYLDFHLLNAEVDVAISPRRIA